MKNSVFHTAFTSSVVLATALLLTGCTSNTSTEPEATGVMNEVIAPVTVNIADMQNGEVEVDAGNIVSVNVGMSQVSSWKAKISDEAIVEFTPGAELDTYNTNPSFKGLKPGSTEVTMFNDVNDVTFTITVK